MLGVIVEIIQVNFNREMDFADLYRNFLGCFLAITFTQIKWHQRNKTIITGFIGVCSLIVFEQSALFSVLSLKYQQYKKVPILADFTLKNEGVLWSEGEIVTNESGNPPFSLQVKIDGGKKYSGFTFKGVHQDWRGYNAIEFRLRNYSKDREKLCIKITDFKHDDGNHAYNNRFNYCSNLADGESIINFSLEDIRNAPHDRKLNLAEISQIGFFMIDLTEEKTILIDDIRLK